MPLNPPAPASVEAVALELRELLAKAQARPWKVEIEAEAEDDDDPKVYVCHSGTVCTATVVATMGWAAAVPESHKVSTAELIVAAVNALPTLLDALAYQAQGEGGLETAKRIVLAEREAFIDPSYAGGPVGAFGELFACDQILKALDQAALAQPATATGQYDAAIPIGGER